MSKAFGLTVYSLVPLDSILKDRVGNVAKVTIVGVSLFRDRLGLLVEKKLRVVMLSPEYRLGNTMVVSKVG